jgi:hypothetical protein
MSVSSYYGYAQSAGITRPNDTTAYASGDLVANSTTAGSVTPFSITNATRGQGIASHVRRITVRKSGTSVTNATFRVHLFCASPTVANGDNAAISFNQAMKYIGSADIASMQAATDGAVGFIAADFAFGAVSSNTIYALLEARGAYTPAAQEVFYIGLDLDLD